MRVTLSLVLSALALAAVGCGGHRTQSYMVPPRIDLAEHQMIGVLEFDSSADGELATLATRRFTEAARQDQGLIRMMDFGSRTEALRVVGRQNAGAETFRLLGSEHGVQTIFTGELVVSDVRPDLSIASTLSSGSLSAKVDVTLSVQLVEAVSGASLWSSSARATRSVGHISVFEGGGFAFDAADPEAAYGALIDSLVTTVTRDFRVSWERR